MRYHAANSRSRSRPRNSIETNQVTRAVRIGPAMYSCYSTYDVSAPRTWHGVARLARASLYVALRIPREAAPMQLARLPPFCLTGRMLGRTKGEKSSHCRASLAERGGSRSRGFTPKMSGVSKLGRSNALSDQRWKFYIVTNEPDFWIYLLHTSDKMIAIGLMSQHSLHKTYLCTN